MLIKQNCKECLLGVQDKCSDLNLSEFDFKNNKWIESNLSWK